MRHATTLGLCLSLLSLPAVAGASDCVDISSQRSWVPLRFEGGGGGVVRSISGSWTVDARSYPRVGAGGHTGDAAARLAPFASSKVVGWANFGALLMRDAGGNIRPVSVGTVIPGGTTHFRINDSDQSLGDNQGALRVCFNVGGTATAPVAAAASATAGAGRSAACQAEDAALARQAEQLKRWRSEVNGEKRRLDRERRRLQQNDNTLSYSHPTDDNPYAARAYDYKVAQHEREVREHNRRNDALNRDMDELNREIDRYNRRVEANRLCR